MNLLVCWKSRMLFFFIDVKLTVCQQQYQQQSASSVPGVFIPRCKPDGSYDDVQCRGSVCFCVDRRGNELRGTRVSIGEGSPKCAMPGVVKFFKAFFGINITQLLTATLFYREWFNGFQASVLSSFCILVDKSIWQSVCGAADINHAFHLYYKCCMWIEFQSISTWLRGFPPGTPVSSLLKIDS